MFIFALFSIVSYWYWAFEGGEVRVSGSFVSFIGLLDLGLALLFFLFFIFFITLRLLVHLGGGIQLKGYKRISIVGA